MELGKRLCVYENRNFIFYIRGSAKILSLQAHLNKNLGNFATL